MSTASKLLAATDQLISRLDGLSFAAPVTHVYNPLEYARKTHEQYVSRFGDGKKRVVMMGMNPGPWGMTQTGVPFGEISVVRDWMGISGPVEKPDNEHTKRPIEGFDCAKSEVSGRRLWGLFSERFPKVDDFFADHYVVNYCPLVWMEESGKNRTPDKLPAAELQSVTSACDEYVATHLKQLKPDFVIGVGAFAEKCIERIAESAGVEATIGRILHPSPASPAANRGWSDAATKQLIAMSVWEN